MSEPSEADIQKACEALIDLDPALAVAYASTDVPVWRTRPLAYETLARIIAYQQISLQAAGSIWARVVDALPAISPDIFLTTSEATLRELGLSRPKIRHLKSIADALQSDRLNFDRLAAGTLAEARAELIAVKGIGPWTAEVFCLYALGNMDAFPVGDVGLMESHRLLTKAETRLDIKAFTKQAAHWQPYRGVAAHLLWGWLHIYRDGKAD